MDEELRVALGAVVQQFGFDEVERALDELREPKDGRRHENKTTRRSGRGGAGKSSTPHRCGVRREDGHAGWTSRGDRAGGGGV